MKKIFAVACLVATIFICGCGNQTARQENSKPKVPVNVVREKLKELSTGLDVRVDDIKETSSGVETFQYPKTIKSVNRGYVGEEYSGLMTDALYKKLQAAVTEGGAKFRLEGRTFGERELTPKEITNMDKVFKIYELIKSVDVEK